jgi:glycosyltransferase involved in cell wall biosynthesis
MKILTGIDVPFIPFGGSLLCSNDWYSNLPKDVEARFLTLAPPPGEQKWWDVKDVVMLDVAKKRGEAEFPGYIAELEKTVRQQIEEFKPDIIHCQHLNYGLSRVIADINTSIPKIGICHGTDVQIATEQPFFKQNLKIICDAMDLLLFPNQNMADDFFAVYGKAKNHIINPLGIPDTYYRAAAPVAFDGNSKLNVLYAGRLLSWKGADIAVQAMRHVTKDIHLTVIGNEDEPGYKNKMVAFVDKYGIGQSVSFKDQLTRDELLEVFSQFDVIVFPSTGIEAFSLTVVEAQARGLPVVASPAGGIVNTLGNGGILLRENTPMQLARTLDSLYDNPRRLSDMQAHGYANAEKYRLSNSQKRLFDISRQLVNSKLS